MRELIHKHSTAVRGDDGRMYEAFIFGQQREDGTWMGWLEFVPVGEGTGSPGESGHTLRTTSETSQPDRRALEYWAGGLEPAYLDGALTRAWP
jgi:hypothetical protein